jgi:hypothetical protein
MGFFFYPLRRLKLFTSARVSRIIFYFHLVLRSLIPRGWEHGLHAARSSRLVETFLLLDLRTFSFPQHLNFLLFFPPPLGDHFSIFNDTLQAPNSPLLPWSTLWHFTCQVLSAVAKVTSSVFCSSFRGEDISPFYISSQRLNLPVSLVSSPFLRLLPPAVGIPFQSTYKPCCSETSCPSSNTEFPISTVHKSLFRPLFPSPHSPTSRSRVYISEPDNLNLYWRCRHFTCSLLALPP